MFDIIVKPCHEHNYFKNSNVRHVQNIRLLKNNVIRVNKNKY